MITRTTPRLALLAAASLLVTGCGGAAALQGAAAPAVTSAPARPSSSPEIPIEVAPQRVPGVGPVNCNREPRTRPLDWTRPLGDGRGGSTWLHVDHGGPTHGCVSISRDHMKDLLPALDPDRHPVVVMGDAASLAR
ncbi:hypothetical protein [Streptomyces sp. NPDC001315]|uniref:hypothetical protein n=1 Tax=Streptomyces sp. NPDC001315 TaxID=3364562 RepID=UPI00369F0D10